MLISFEWRNPRNKKFSFKINLKVYDVSEHYRIRHRRFLIIHLQSRVEIWKVFINLQQKHFRNSCIQVIQIQVFLLLFLSEAQPSKVYTRWINCVILNVKMHLSQMFYLIVIIEITVEMALSLQRTMKMLEILACKMMSFKQYSCMYVITSWFGLRLTHCFFSTESY